MFLDDELTQIVEIIKDPKEQDVKIFNLMRCKVKDLTQLSGLEYRNGLKRLDSSWRLFTKKNKGFDSEWFQKYILGLPTLNQEQRKFICKDLKWNPKNIPSDEQNSKV